MHGSYTRPVNTSQIHNPNTLFIHGQYIVGPYLWSINGLYNSGIHMSCKLSAHAYIWPIWPVWPMRSIYISPYGIHIRATYMAHIKVPYVSGFILKYAASCYSDLVCCFSFLHLASSSWIFILVVGCKSADQDAAS